MKHPFSLSLPLLLLLTGLPVQAKITSAIGDSIELPKGTGPAFIGECNGQDVMIRSSRIYGLSDSRKWLEMGARLQGIDVRATASTDLGIICFGMSDGTSDACRLLQVSSGFECTVSELPPCPAGTDPVICAARGSSVFAVVAPDVLTMDLSEKDRIWRPLSRLPEGGTPIAAVVQNGEHQQVNLYVFRSDETGRTAVWSLPVDGKGTRLRKWEKVSESAVERLGGTPVAVPSGCQHVLFLGGQGMQAYHTITGKWFAPSGLSGVGMPGCLSAVWKRDGSLLVLQMPQGEGGGTCRQIVFHRERTLHPFNMAVIALFFVGMAALGVYFMRRNRSSDDYFRAGGRLPWWAVSLSIYATMFSSITFLSIPALAYATDWRYAGLEIGILVLAPVVAWYYLPFFRRLNLTSAYEYLEVRFNLACRLFASGAFCLFMVARTAIVTYLPAVALTAVMDMDVNVAIVIVTLVTIVYCTLGGIEAVIWSDCIQSLILIVSTGLILCWLILGTDGGLGGFLSVGAEAGKFRFFDMALDWTQPTFWVVLVGGIVANLASYTSDQCVVQRYMTTKDEKGAAKSILTNGVLSFVNALVFFAIGTALFTFFRSHPEALDVTMPQNDSIFPLFIADNLPPGLSGLILAAVAAATMSTLSTNLNSAATAVTTDFYARLVPGADERGKMLCGRVTTVLTGVLGGMVALALANMEVQAIYDQFQRFLGILTGGLGCLFLMGVFMPRIKGKAALAGLVANYAVCIGLDAWMFQGKPHLLLYGFFGVIACLVVAGTLSLGKTTDRERRS